MVTLVLSTAALVLLTAAGAGALLYIAASLQEPDEREEAEHAAGAAPGNATKNAASEPPPVTAAKPENAASEAACQKRESHERQRRALAALSRHGVDDVAPVFAAVLAPGPTGNPQDALATFAVMPMIPAEVQSVLKDARTLRLVFWAEGRGWHFDAHDGFEIATVGAATWLARRLRQLEGHLSEQEAHEASEGGGHV